MSLYGYPALYALGVWWFATGLIIYLDCLPRHTFRWSMPAATAVFVIALYRLWASSADTSVPGAYAAFTYGVLIWGWQEMSFFTGQLTGPRKTASPARPGGLRHFWHGIETCLYHELAIIASAAAVVALTWGAPNQVGRWSFLLLWAMRQSAKLNVFLGVLNLSEEFLPEHLLYLRSYMARRPMNLLFPVSVTAGTVLAVSLVDRATASGIQPFRAAGLTFLIAMLGLGILEHWFLVLPLPLAPLWTWLLQFRRPAEPKIHAAPPPHRGVSDPRGGIGRLARTAGGPVVPIP